MATQYYTVVAGDSLWGISHKFGMTVDELVALNHLGSSHAVIYPGNRLVVKGAGNTPVTPNYPTTSVGGNGKLDKLVGWFKENRGKIRYDMERRMSPGYRDCSSAVYCALIHAGFLSGNAEIGNTETLYGMENSLLIPITRAEARYGDIFVAGVKGHSLYGGGHTGVFLDNGHIIHCTSPADGITEDKIGYETYLFGITDLPLYCYRLRGGEGGNTGHVAPTQPTPQPKPQPAPTGNETLVKQYAESGKFTANQTVSIYNSANSSSHAVNTLDPGESVTYDQVYITTKFVYISYISYSGTRRYVPIRTMTNGQRGPLRGTII